MRKIVITAAACLWAVVSFANHWTPNVDFEFNTTLTGIVEIDGVEQRSETLELGVFCNGECRGSQMPVYVALLDRYVYFTQIYGLMTDEFTFKLYDHGADMELNLVSPDAVAFDEDGFGSLSNPFLLDFTEAIQVSYTVSANSDPAVAGVVEGAGVFAVGTTVTLTATANVGYAFLNWTEGGVVVSNAADFTFDVTRDRELVAHFIVSDSHWLANSDFEFDMTLTSVVWINGVEQQSETLELGVFCNGECRSSQKPMYIDVLDRYVYFMHIYGLPTDAFTFKLYDHSQSKELYLQSPEAVSYQVDGYGNLATPFVLDFTSYVFQINVEANPSEGGAVVIGSIGVGEELVFDFENGWQGWTTLKGTTGNSPNNWRHNTEHVTYSGGNPHDWSSFGHNNSSGFMISESYLSATSANGTAYGAVTPDNYLVSPQVRLGGSISFYAGARNTSYCAEKFSVMVSTTNNTSTDSFTTVATWILSLPSAGYTTSPYYVDLSAYSGMGYVAIRHHDCNDQWVLCVDDITIVEGPGNIADSNIFNYGETCVVTALPSTDFHFVNWTKNGVVVSTDETYSFIVTGNSDYVANFVSDNSEEPVVITLNRGWNWIGYLPWTEMTINVALANLNPSDGDILKSQSSFCAFNASAGLWEGALNTLTPGSGLIYLRNDETTSFSYPPDSENVVITLNPGWNWIAYLPRTEMTIESAFVSLTPNDGDLVKSQQSYSIYNAATGQWEGNLRVFQPGRGIIYQNNSNVTMTFSYPGN